ncbi:MAG: DUF427 domain-containing protein [Kineosporiaceae bacterium]|nr:DUF427 domain-containing protein [Aeromicrobium sp.]
MAIDLNEQWFRDLAELRYGATPKRVRALLKGQTVLDTRDAVLVYEPRRVVPWYAVPPGDLHLNLTEHDPSPVPDSLPPVLAPHHHNEWHTVPGTSLHLDGYGEVAFRPDEPGLGGRIVLRWEPFDWLEEDEPAMGHPRDPFKRIDVLRSDRHVRVEVGGSTIAESCRSMMLVETGLPVRWYVPRADVQLDALQQSDKHTVCAYKGVAAYLSAEGAPDVAWFYPEPLNDALPVKDSICFWSPARVYVDGEAVNTSMPGQ